MSRKKQVLYLGYVGYSALSKLARSIREYSDDFSITAADPIMPDGTLPCEDENSFDKIIKLPKKRETHFNSGQKRATFIRLVKDSSKRKAVIRKMMFGKQLNHYIESETEESLFSVKAKRTLEGFDIFHFHYAAPEFLTWLKYVPIGKKIIISLWGSDLFQSQGVKNYKSQLKAFEKADFITLNTNEMNEFFLNKFGRNFQTKVRRAYFVLDDCRFEKIDSGINEPLKDKFRKAHGISPEKRIVVVGYSSASKQRHIEILRVLGRLDQQVKNRIHLVIPMMYGHQYEDRGYIDKVKEETTLSGMTNTILEKYLNGEELHEYIAASDIKLNLRETDSMNAALVESLIAGNIVVSGAWLPYKILKKAGAVFHEVDEIEELEKLLPKIIENFDFEKARTKNNSPIIRKFFSKENLVKDWINIYKE